LLSPKKQIKCPVNLSAVLKGSLIALVSAVFFSFLLSFIYWLTPLSEATLGWLAFFIVGASTLGGAAIAGKEAGSRGLYHGLAVGLVFFSMSLAFSFVFFSGHGCAGLWQEFLLAAIAGAAGGVVGVGLS